MNVEVWKAIIHNLYFNLADICFVLSRRSPSFIHSFVRSFARPYRLCATLFEHTNLAHHSHPSNYFLIYISFSLPLWLSARVLHLSMDTLFIFVFVFTRWAFLSFIFLYVLRFLGYGCQQLATFLRIYRRKPVSDRSLIINLLCGGTKLKEYQHSMWHGTKTDTVPKQRQHTTKKSTWKINEHFCHEYLMYPIATALFI